MSNQSQNKGIFFSRDKKENKKKTNLIVNLMNCLIVNSRTWSWIGIFIHIFDFTWIVCFLFH